MSFHIFCPLKYFVWGITQLLTFINLELLHMKRFLFFLLIMLSTSIFSQNFLLVDSCDVLEGDNIFPVKSIIDGSTCAFVEVSNYSLFSVYDMETRHILYEGKGDFDYGESPNFTIAVIHEKPLLAYNDHDGYRIIDLFSRTRLDQDRFDKGELFLNTKDNRLWLIAEKCYYEEGRLINTIKYIYQLGKITSSAVSNSSVELNKYSLGQNYPNPFNAVTKIDYEISAPGNYSLNIYDTKGSLLETIPVTADNSGRNTHIWNAKNYSSGVYFYQLEGVNEVTTKKMVLLK